MYDEPIKALRLCADECEEDCERCAYYKHGCMPKMMRDAADAIERLQAEATAYKKITQMATDEINKLRYQLHMDEMDIEEIKLP